jgi:hypothetical protein
MDERYLCKLIWRVQLPPNASSLEKRLWNAPKEPRSTCVAGDTLQAAIIDHASLFPKLERFLKYGKPPLAANSRCQDPVWICWQSARRSAPCKAHTVRPEANRLIRS